MGQYNFLLEASGTLISGFFINAVQKAGAKAIASDIGICAATYLADDFLIFPKYRDPDLWKITDLKLKEKDINVVIPTLDETLLEWSERKNYYKGIGVNVIISELETLRIFQDKWETYRFFTKHGIPTPITSLEHEYSVVKPRSGRGGTGVLLNTEPNTLDMTDQISQEKLHGTEYTIDVFCSYTGEPVYIIPRTRARVIDGKSLEGTTICHRGIIDYVKKICKNIEFQGPINIQCFESAAGKIKFTEINPRLGGGTALGITATENWATLIIRNIIEKKHIKVKPTQFGLKMYRYYSEVFN